MHPLVKWPGGKTRELDYIQTVIPEHGRYVEPFCGGAAVFFHLEPAKAVLNDINEDLITFYSCIRDNVSSLKAELDIVSSLRDDIAALANKNGPQLLSEHRNHTLDEKCVEAMVTAGSSWPGDLRAFVIKSILAKAKRLADREAKTGKWDDSDVADQFKTAHHAGLYTWVRDGMEPSNAVEASARFFYLREFCYGSMFRFNAEGKFNIPYGGFSYDKKDFAGKIATITKPEVTSLLKGAELHNQSFFDLVDNLDLNDTDFMFLDPPYDTEFADYDRSAFRPDDQEKLAEVFASLPCKALMIIGKTELTEKLYRDIAGADPKISIDEYEKTYAYNVRGRNNRSVEHLAIRNY